jgi:hypothetical protein
VQEKILALAAGIVGGEATELLAALCAAAETMWTRRLREGVSPKDCEETLCCAAAFSAAADALAGQSGGVESFTAGVVSVKGQSGSERAEQAKSLRQTAERLMAPYTVSADLCLKGVRG